jgi:6-phosphogluconolactonase
VTEPETLVVDDPAGVLAGRLAAQAQAGAHIALTGGSTPRAAYERAAAMGDWSHATLWFGDERCVPPDSEQSNYAMAKAALLDRLPGAPPTVHRMRGEDGPHEGAREYAAQLRDAFGDGVPRLDLVLLGLGPDAHVASLFPDQDALQERERTVVGVDSPGMAPLVPRISLTLPVINAARTVIFLVSGAEKADAVARAFDGPPSGSAPGSLVAPADGSLVRILDPPAAERLRTPLRPARQRA